MAVDFTSIPTSLVDEELRSSLQNARRQMLLRWSSGEYLTAIAGNYGVHRPLLGFSDDEYFRAIAQVVLADFKNIGLAFWQILEATLGPWIHPNATNQYLDFVLETEALAGKKHFVLKSTGLGVDQVSIERLIAWFGHGTLSPGIVGLEEEVTFTTVDKFQRRVRVKDALVNTHPANTVFRVHGGCWDFIETRARRVAIRINCEQLVEATLRGDAYLHPDPWVTLRLRADAKTLDNELKLDDGDLQFAISSFPVGLEVDPDNRTLDGKLYLEGSGYNAATRTMTLIGGAFGDIPSRAGSLERRYPKGTKVKIPGKSSANIGVLGASIGATTLNMYFPHLNPAGAWWIDEASVTDRELIFITSSNYQRSYLSKKVVLAGEAQLRLSYPLFGIPEGAYSFWIQIRDYETGVVTGPLLVNSTQWYEGGDVRRLNPILFLSSSVGTAPISAHAMVEVVSGSPGTNTVQLSAPLTKNHAAGALVTRALGVNFNPTYNSHISNAYWPQTDGTVSPAWPGPYLYDAGKRSPNVLPKVGATAPAAALPQSITATIDTDPFDCRTHLFNVPITSDYDPGTALDWPYGPVFISGQQHFPKVVYIPAEDTLLFPDWVLQVQSWLADADNPHPGYPPLVTVGSEGTFGRDPVYLWGRDTLGAVGKIYISGLQNGHPAGTKVISYVEQLPVTTDVPVLVPGLIGNDNGFPLFTSPFYSAKIGNHLIIDHSTEVQEDVNYDSMVMKTTTTGYFVFDRGWRPKYSHPRIRTFSLNPDILTVNTKRVVARADTVAESNQDGYSFPVWAGTIPALRRLRVALDWVRAAGVKVDLYDEHDRLIEI